MVCMNSLARVQYLEVVAGIGSLMAYRSKMEYDESARSPVEQSLLNHDDTRV